MKMLRDWFGESASQHYSQVTAETCLKRMRVEKGGREGYCVGYHLVICTPHSWALVVRKHEMNTIMNLNIHSS
jgi:hypothetical protein